MGKAHPTVHQCKILFEFKSLRDHLAPGDKCGFASNIDLTCFDLICGKQGMSRPVPAYSTTSASTLVPGECPLLPGSRRNYLTLSMSGNTQLRSSNALPGE